MFWRMHTCCIIASVCPLYVYAIICVGAYCVCVCVLGGCSGVGEHPRSAQQSLHSLHVEVVRGPYALVRCGAHSIVQHVQEGGVELGVRCQLRAEGGAVLTHGQPLAPLGTKQIQGPGLFSHWLGLQLLTHLTERDRGHNQYRI